MGRRRQLTEILIEGAKRSLPAGRRRWGEGMEDELPQISDEWEAVRWAFGCFVAANGERIRSMHVLNTLPVRLGLVMVIAFKIFDDIIATVGTLAYKAGALGLTDTLGKQMPGDDYTRLIPLMEAIPAWLHGLWVLAAGLSLIAAVLIILERGSAYLLVLSALGVEILAQQLGRPIIAATGVVVNPNPSVIATVIIPFVIPLGIAAVLWLGRQRPTSIAKRQGGV
jgi:hypothetical protein